MSFSIPFCSSSRVSLSDDTPNSDTSTVDQEATDGLLLTEENSVSDSNVNSCLSSTERSKEWRDSLADVWDSKCVFSWTYSFFFLKCVFRKRQDDQCFDDGILDPLLSEIDPPLKESLPPLRWFRLSVCFSSLTLHFLKSEAVSPMGRCLRRVRWSDNRGRARGSKWWSKIQVYAWVRPSFQWSNKTNGW